ncbi:dihydrofolate reductase family protein [Propionibacteriaceae bacterium G57]|uniref:dihydrofolate reductase family protein n=1 Tax=Aestuariimicrobium sp. G57 TaxID=3418485 RepID=UPI003DA73ACE
MATLTYYTATTLDGFLADQHDSLAWLLRQDLDEHGSANYGDFIRDIGAIVMGATTYEWVRQHDPDNWEYTMPTWVLTHRDLAAPPGADVRFSQGSVRQVYDEMAAAAGDKQLWVVGGGDLAGQFADEGLLDEIVVSIAPVVLGAGRLLLPRRLELELLETGRNAGFVTARYRVAGRLLEDR